MPISLPELRALIAQGESEQLEFKTRTTHPTRISRTLVSLANTRGGHVLIGVDDRGRIVGVRDAEEERFLLRQATAHYIEPPLPMHVQEVEDDERTVLVVEVAESSHKPHKALVGEDDWRGYIRVGAASVQTSRLTEKVLQQEPPEPRFERIPLNRHEQAALDYVRDHPRLTLPQYEKLINVSRRRAHRLLIKLVLHGYLRYHDKEKEPYYTRG
ncbi:ATP-binding protein [Hymenobacter busanensis]|uniref:ATP-binding protein n=1 Tax=Hymenobacter busanensis TaxID=2607656 RepID=A0A7L4ZXM9_9BACT|nr:ATP-binding protein [Hymenobacter busanensis]KAA9327462.1 ATP-binding protein [Hymenobacter busanensis]QHJ06200.1 ATP-binding protein [Hymenobacter busanensis]